MKYISKLKMIMFLWKIFLVLRFNYKIKLGYWVLVEILVFDIENF